MRNNLIMQMAAGNRGLAQVSVQVSKKKLSIKLANWLRIKRYLLSY